MQSHSALATLQRSIVLFSRRISTVPGCHQTLPSLTEAVAVELLWLAGICTIPLASFSFGLFFRLSLLPRITALLMMPL